MVRPDDSSLEPYDLEVVQARAIALQNKADAWDTFPAPVSTLVDAAGAKLELTSAFDANSIANYLLGKAASAATKIKSAIEKVFGLYDAADGLIHLDNSVLAARRTFVALHETGHHDIPTHRKMFRLFQDCKKTLSPDIADLFEREANNFARILLFKGDRFAAYAADEPLELKTPIALAKKFGASLYASAREYARTHSKACAVYVLEPIEFGVEGGATAKVRRFEPSPCFQEQFGESTLEEITPDHVLWGALPIGRKMTRPIAFSITDKSGDVHECLAEAFDTTWNILLLLMPKRALTRSTLIVPPGTRRHLKG